MLLAHSSGLYIIHDWIPILVDDFAATGSGLEHAEAALFLGKTTVEAANVAIALAYGCGGDVVTKSVKLATQK